MITLNEYLGGKVNKRKKLIPRDKKELRSIIEQRLEKSHDLDLNDIDVSEVEDMKELFEYLNIETIDISGWNIDVIDGYMFWECKKLKSIILPDSIESIGNSAFHFCGSLTKIDIPDSVEIIGDGAFFGCNRLTKINISDSVENIGFGAFSGCNSLTNINIPDSVKSIGDWAFNGCNKLIEINIPDSVKSIGKSAFVEVHHITYHGPAMWEFGNEYWGAKSMN